MKHYDLTVNGISTMVTGSNLYNSEVDRFMGVVTDERLASHLAAITTSDKATDALGVAKAFHAWSVTKEDAKREGFKTETELLMNLTGLSKSSISQLRLVGGLFADDEGNFTVPEQLKGYTVGQVYEVMSKNKGIVTADDFATICDENGITCTSSAKDIRATFDPLTKEERDGVNRVKAVKAATNKLDRDGMTLWISDSENVGKVKVAVLEFDPSMTDDEIEKLKKGDFHVTIQWTK